MSTQKLEICDQFVHIPLAASTSTASLNVLVAGSIVFHEFFLKTNQKKAEIQGHKFETKRRTKLDRFLNPTDVEFAEIEEKRERRRNI